MTAVSPEASRQAVVEAALVLLERMGLTPADLAAVPQHRPKVPTFAGYVPVVSAAVSAGTRRAYGSYWNRVVEHWGSRRLDEPTPSEIRHLMAYVKTHVVARRNAPTPDNPEIKAAYDKLKPAPLQPPPAVFAAVWPPCWAAISEKSSWPIRSSSRCRARRSCTMATKLGWVIIFGCRIDMASAHPCSGTTGSTPVFRPHNLAHFMRR